MLLESDTGARCAQMVDKEQDDLYVRFKTLQRQLEFIEIQVCHTPAARCCCLVCMSMCMWIFKVVTRWRAVVRVRAHPRGSR